MTNYLRKRHDQLLGPHKILPHHGTGGSFSGLVKNLRTLADEPRRIATVSAA